MAYNKVILRGTMCIDDEKKVLFEFEPLSHWIDRHFDLEKNEAGCSYVNNPQQHVCLTIELIDEALPIPPPPEIEDGHTLD